MSIQPNLAAKMTNEILDKILARHLIVQTLTHHFNRLDATTTEVIGKISIHFIGQ